MYSVYDTRCRVGCPIRISTDQRLLAAPRGFSQRATSFIASWCQGIHRMPFSYSISHDRPGPVILMQTIRFASHHAQKPSSEKNKDGPANSHLHNRNFPERPGQRIAYAIRRKIHPAKSFTAPLNPRRPTHLTHPCFANEAGPCPAKLELLFERSRGSDKSAERRDPRSVRRQISNHTRPETHQNLIHISKEQARPPNDDRGATTYTA